MVLVPTVLRLYDKATDATSTTQVHSTTSSNTQTGDAPKKRSLLRLPVRASKSQVTPVQVFSSSSGSRLSKRSKKAKKAKKAAKAQKKRKRKSNSNNKSESIQSMRELKDAGSSSSDEYSDCTKLSLGHAFQ
ncbi:hypothetical protein PINS_up001060 [Pythium insidiosum]|nr:hypothetical protein PINS_up001060 [Pythium insidiosum]